MYVRSGGTLVRKGVDFTGSWASDQQWRGGSALGGQWNSYGGIYRANLWVSVLVNKLARAQARLPLKVYVRDDVNGRAEDRDHPYARLLRNPSSRHDPFTFYEWTAATEAVFGDAFWGKIRDAGGRPVELVLLHPSSMRANVDRDTGARTWSFANGNVTIDAIPDSDIVHFHTFNPDDPTRGMSPLEPLRATLENEDAARRATSSFWRNGARPGMALTHPGTLSAPAQARLKLQWQNIAAGADRTGTTVVLEEGMKAEPITLTAEEAQYIESRKLNREETCAAYDVPPPVVHILDHATFSNITEQMRSMYRDTMAPRLGKFESVLETSLRGSRRPGATEPDFGDDVYAEYLLDEVLRGDFETRADAIQKAINSGQRTPNEARRMDNLPPLAGGDALYINSTMVPLAKPGVDEDAPKPDRAVDVALELVTAAPSLVQAPGLPVLVDQLRAILDGKPMPALPPVPPAAPVGGAAVRSIPADVVRTVMGRLSRPTSPTDVDIRGLVTGLGEHAGPVVVALMAALASGEDITALRARVGALTVKGNTP